MHRGPPLAYTGEIEHRAPKKWVYQSHIAHAVHSKEAYHESILAQMHSGNRTNKNCISHFFFRSHLNFSV